MPTARAIELHVGSTGTGRGRLEIVTEDHHGERFVVEVEGPEMEVRAEAALLAAQFELTGAAGELVAV